jgi:UrcA family protein
MNRFAKITIAALVLSGAQAAVADRSVQLSTTVKYAELDLSQPEAVEVLHRRLSNAAEEVCSPLDSRQLSRQLEYRRCVAETLSRAVAGVDRPMLTQYHVQKHGLEMPRVAAR